MKRINLEADLKVPVDKIGESAPDMDLIPNTLLALWKISELYDDPKGFWVRAGQVMDVLEENDLISDEATSYNIGRLLSKTFRFHRTKRISDGMLRWVPRDALEKLIEYYNTEEFDSVDYGTIRDAVWKELLGDAPNPMGLGFDRVSVKKACVEYDEIGSEEARRRLNES